MRKSLFQLLTVLLFSGISNAQPPQTISFQGRLNPATAIPAACARLLLNGSPVAGTDQALSLNPNANGVFVNTLNLNSANIATAGNYTIRIYDGACGGGTLLTTIPLNSVPFALEANKAITADSALTANTATTANSANSVPWTGITGMPAGFSDGTDNTGVEVDTLDSVLGRGNTTSRSMTVGGLISDGNVGVGIAIPHQKLHVHNNIGNTYLKISAPATNQDASVQFNDGSANNWFIGMLGAGGLPDNFSINRNGGLNGMKLTVTGAGNVGIGIPVPTSKLHVSGGDIKISGGQLLLDDTQRVVWANGAGTVAIEGNKTTSYLKFSTSNQEKMRIDASGNIGIGTPTPDNKLEIKSPAANSNVVAIERSGGTQQIFQLQEDGSGNGTLLINDTAGTNKIQLSASGNSLIQSGNLSMGGNKITSLGAPSDGSDAATKTYVDAQIASIPPASGSSAIGLAPKLQQTYILGLNSSVDVANVNVPGRIRGFAYFLNTGQARIIIIIDGQTLLSFPLPSGGGFGYLDMASLNSAANFQIKTSGTPDKNLDVSFQSLQLKIQTDPGTGGASITTYLDWEHQ